MTKSYQQEIIVKLYMHPIYKYFLKVSKILINVPPVSCKYNVNRDGSSACWPDIFCRANHVPTHDRHLTRSGISNLCRSHRRPITPPSTLYSDPTVNETSIPSNDGYVVSLRGPRGRLVSAAVKCRGAVKRRSFPSLARVSRPANNRCARSLPASGDGRLLALRSRRFTSTLSS